MEEPYRENPSHELFVKGEVEVFKRTEGFFLRVGREFEEEGVLARQSR